jgi:hypothetical protein
MEKENVRLPCGSSFVSAGVVREHETRGKEEEGGSGGGNDSDWNAYVISSCVAA